MEESRSYTSIWIGEPSKDKARLSQRAYDIVKRGGDVVVSAVLLILLAPLLGWIGILVKRDSSGPVLYRGLRMGRGGNVFPMLKFRSMYEQAESYAGPPLTAEGDTRVTRVGRWLRATKLNELPQLWNVLVGEMSLVGPRPEYPKLAEAWPEAVRAELLSVRPGITSPASVLYRDEENLLPEGGVFDSYIGKILPSKMRLDQLYVRHRSLLLDLDVLFWTAITMLLRVRHGLPKVERLFVGPFSKLMRRHVSWFLVDSWVTLVAIGVSGLMWRSIGPFNIGIGKSLGIAVGFALVYSVMGALVGINRVVWSRATLADGIELARPLALATIMTIAINNLWKYRPGLPTGMLLTAAFLAYTGFVAVRFRTRLMRALAERLLRIGEGVSRAQERVLIVGGGESGQFAAWWLKNSSMGRAFRVVGFVDDDLYKQDSRLRGVEVLGRREDIPALVKRHDVGVILYAIHNISEEERKKVLAICAASPARVIKVPDLPGKLCEAMRGNWNGYESRKGKEGNVPREKVMGWLSELDEISRSGDIAATQTYIQNLREQIRTERASEVE